MTESLDAHFGFQITRCKRCTRWEKLWTDDLAFRTERDSTRSLWLPGSAVRHLPAFYGTREPAWRPLCGWPFRGAQWLGEPW